MAYLGNPPDVQKEMLAELGLARHDELFRSIPEALRLKGELNVPPAETEMELTGHVRALAKRNRPAGDMVGFLGGGVYDHFIPAAVDQMASRGEYLTCYTPYQAEASQGTLQVLWEYQTMIAELTGMALANASLYDGASAVAEAAMMATSATRRKKVIVSQTIHPESIECLKTYLINTDLELATVPWKEGCTDMETIAGLLDDETACVIAQTPNFFGVIEQLDKLSELVHAIGALLVVSVDPISLGLLKSPGEYDADIVVGEGQSLGLPMNMGGPSLGFLATQKKFARQIPGRLVARTVDRHGTVSYCLTLQTREQHIRREKATSNICTNEGLMTVRAMLYLSLLGAAGLKEVAQLCAAKTHYLAEEFSQIKGFRIRYAAPFFKEFVLECDQPADRVLARVAKRGILGGVPLARFYPQMANRLLVAVTEKRTRSELDAFIAAVSQ
ncbi:MAG: aminomethyl-transferring glycine dehydrogenase subunit GcvPA [Planctomycetes bacterium]|nr:aminomethyl-transferring glycine dehydrogenase subunit GcvPA [Planctomycetota bacterium]